MSFKEKAVPDTVIRFGAQPVSKPLSLYLKKVRPATVIAVDESPEFGIRSASLRIISRLHPKQSFKLLWKNRRHLIRSCGQRRMMLHLRLRIIMRVLHGDEGIICKNVI